jgi:hypothetical protein
MKLEKQLLDLQSQHDALKQEVDRIAATLIRRDILKPAPKAIVPRPANPRVDVIRMQHTPAQEGIAESVWLLHHCVCDRKQHETTVFVNPRQLNTFVEIIPQCGRRLDVFLKIETEGAIK